MGVKFKVFKGKDGQHYAHMTTSNGRITWQSEGYTRASGAFKVCTSTWNSIGKSIDPRTVLQWPVVPYARDSLKPRILS